MGWVIEDFTKSELQQSWWTVVLDIQKVPLQGSYSVPAESVLVFYCNVKVRIKKSPVL
jgi:L-rhamnose mutarotase